MTTVTSVTPVTCDSVTHPFKGVTCHARSGRALKTQRDFSARREDDQPTKRLQQEGGLLRDWFSVRSALSPMCSQPTAPDVECSRSALSPDCSQPESVAEVEVQVYIDQFVVLDETNRSKRVEVRVWGEIGLLVWNRDGFRSQMREAIENATKMFVVDWTLDQQ